MLSVQFLWQRDNEGLYERILKWESSLDKYFKEPIETADILRDGLLDLEDNLPDLFSWRELLGSRLFMLDAGLLSHSMKPINRARILPTICMAFASWGGALQGFGEEMEPYFIPLDKPNESIAEYFTGFAGAHDSDEKFYACLNILNQQQRECIVEFIELYFGIYQSTVNPYYTAEHAQAAKQLAEIWRNG